MNIPRTEALSAEARYFAKVNMDEAHVPLNSHRGGAFDTHGAVDRRDQRIYMQRPEEAVTYGG